MTLVNANLEIANAAQDDFSGSCRAYARRCRARARQCVGLVGRTSRLAWMASWLVPPAGGSRLCRPDLWRLHSPARSVDAVWSRGPLGQCVLLRTRLPRIAERPGRKPGRL